MRVKKCTKRMGINIELGDSLILYPFIRIILLGSPLKSATYQVIGFCPTDSKGLIYICGTDLKSIQ